MVASLEIVRVTILIPISRTNTNDNILFLIQAVFTPPNPRNITFENISGDSPYSMSEDTKMNDELKKLPIRPAINPINNDSNDTMLITNLGENPIAFITPYSLYLSIMEE